jgi:multidrug resistance efflux pump
MHCVLVELYRSNRSRSFQLALIIVKHVKLYEEYIGSWEHASGSLDSWQAELDRSVVNEVADVAAFIARARELLVYAKDMKERAVKAAQASSVSAAEASETSANMKKREGKTQDPAQKDLYAARGREEDAKANVMRIKAEYEKAKIALADAKIAVANVKMKKAAKK